MRGGFSVRCIAQSIAVDWSVAHSTSRMCWKNSYCFPLLTAYEWKDSSSVIAGWWQINFFSIDDFAECNIFVGKVPVECVTDAGKKVWVRHYCIKKMSGMNIFNLLFLVLMYEVSFKKDAVFWVVAVCSSSRNLPNCQINLLPPSSVSDVEAAGCCKVLLNFPSSKWQHFLEQVFFIVSTMRTSSLISSIQFNSIDRFKWRTWDFRLSHGCWKCYKFSGM
jgi:hypothetical protein